MSVLVTGGTSGIGLEIALGLAEPGRDVFLNYHSNEEAAESAAERILDAGAVPHLLKADLGSLEGIRSLSRGVAEAVSGLDVIVHAAARAVTGRLLDIPGEELNRAIATNGSSLAHLVRECQGLLSRGSSLIYVTSKGSERALNGYGPLGGPKAMAEQMMRYLATELAPRGVRVNAISPGPVDTEARRRMFPDTWERRLKDQAALTPAGRTLEPGDLAGVIQLMVDPRFSLLVQGQVITVDGGLSL